MTFLEVETELEKAQSKLLEIFRECYVLAEKEIRGNWQDPSVMKRRRELAVAIADSRLAETDVKVQWTLRALQSSM